MACILGIFNLGIRQSRAAMRTPVDNSVASVNKSLVVKVYKNLTYGTGKSLVHCEAQTCPVTRCTELLKLADNGGAVLSLPIPYSFKEFFTSEVITCKSLVLSEVFLNLYLRCDTCVVGTGKPKGGKALHSLVTDKNILKRFIKGVAHMKLSCYVWRRNNYRKCGLAVIYIGCEVTAVTPRFVKSFLDLTRVISLFDLFHFVYPFNL